jgi:dethiobiotin synthetase
MPVVFITGTDTGVGKTVLAALLTRRLRSRAGRVVALKPVCSGGRADARMLHRAQSGALPLDEINPWHFRAPLAPPLAAALAGRRLKLTDIARHVRRHTQKDCLVLVEGAGGLLSPLSSDGDNLDLLRALRARPVVVVPNRLGAINQALLARAALSAPERHRALWVLVAPRRVTLVHRLNLRFLRRRLGGRSVFVLPFLEARRRRGMADGSAPSSAEYSLTALAARLRARSPR